MGWRTHPRGQHRAIDFAGSGRSVRLPRAHNARCPARIFREVELEELPQDVRLVRTPVQGGQGSLVLRQDPLRDLARDEAERSQIRETSVDELLRGQIVVGGDVVDDHVRHREAHPLFPGRPVPQIPGIAHRSWPAATATGSRCPAVPGFRRTWPSQQKWHMWWPLVAETDAVSNNFSREGKHRAHHPCRPDASVRASRPGSPARRAQARRGRPGTPSRTRLDTRSKHGQRLHATIAGIRHPHRSRGVAQEMLPVTARAITSIERGAPCRQTHAAEGLAQVEGREEDGVMNWASSTVTANHRPSVQPR